MLIRAYELRREIDEFTSKYNPARIFSLSYEEWIQIEYLIDITRPFNFFTTAIGKSTAPTLPYTFGIYDELFEKLEECHRRLSWRVKKYYWIRDLITGIEAAQAKLSKYYKRTYSNIGSIYAIGAILNPNTKLSQFDEKYCWLDFTKTE